MTDAGPWVRAVAAVLVTFAVVVLVYFVLRRVMRNQPALREGFGRTHRPVQAVALVIVVRATIPPLLGEWEQPVAQFVTACLVGAIAWLLGTVVLRIEDVALGRYQVDLSSGVAVRRMHTQISVVRRVTMAVIAFIAVGAILTTFPQARAAGASLLASAGVIGMITALAAQSTMGNMFASLQLAFGNALRINDVVVVEDEWGRIEAMTLGYVVVRIWDDRRLILPSSYFTTTPFENWTRSDTALTGSVELDVDWSVPVEQMREAARRVAESSELWDRRRFGLQITEATGGLVRARITVTAADSGAAWNLRCLIREEMVKWLQQEHPSALPRQRAELHGVVAEAAGQLPKPRA